MNWLDAVEFDLIITDWTREADASVISDIKEVIEVMQLLQSHCKQVSYQSSSNNWQTFFMSSNDVLYPLVFCWSVIRFCASTSYILIADVNKPPTIASSAWHHGHFARFKWQIVLSSRPTTIARIWITWQAQPMAKRSGRLCDFAFSVIVITSLDVWSAVWTRKQRRQLSVSWFVFKCNFCFNI